jgi:hypothetical protein
MESPEIVIARRTPWNKGKLVGQKAPLKLKEIWAIRVRLQLENRRRELALFNLAIDKTSRVRPGKAAGARRLPWASCRIAGNRVATKDSTAGAV